MAGQIGELARDTLRRDFRAIDPRTARILLVEAADRVLTTFPPSLSERPQRSLEKLGVTVLHTPGPWWPSTTKKVTIEDADGDVRSDLPAVPSSGRPGSPRRVSRSRLGRADGAELDRAGRVTVGPDLTLPGHPEVFAIGDMVRVQGADGTPVTLPGVAPVAMQQGRYAAKVTRARLR